MGTKAMCGVINTDGDALPLLATDNADGTATLKVDTEITATIDPSGLATTAKQDTGNGYLTTLAGAVSGTEMQVDLVGSVPAGTNLIGKVGIDQVTANANEVVVKDSGIMGTMQDDIALIKADIAAIRAILES